MGVVGAGKTTVGQLLAEHLGWPFADADDFHSPENVEKIRNGHPLTNEDRRPWLAALHEAVVGWDAAGVNAVLACSALKHEYREALQAGSTRFVYLKGSREIISSRLGNRRGHFATDSILESQFADLEEPTNAVTVTIDKRPDAIVEEVLAKLNLAN
jgi:gluconokinase